ncbi:maleylpyruvate isomerase family mycothiol-dependent enzyme [Amycolatopsis sp. CA-230715]|uniref:maleylpyruvate isomerase family mycothiol-dependent enzyme n=1 Tax=Amycolatopsis sp. CA-230715 TaxID=2745196 RepID=UPI001C03A16B|nr:maleylpyruvate isomerase family mycothiol-dependent enzyme [Amycolatopsis sp. CA-230715]QWF82404.1 hypothetical protein HUW46_05841 [Amycolatopsis sp. CA-230715]
MTEIEIDIAEHRRALATVLEGLDDGQWDTPSLCAGWRVREVAAHLTMPFRYKLPKVALGMLKARGNFARMADRAARHDAATMTTAELTAALADNADFVWKPPGGGMDGALSHDVIHGLDITVPLGIDLPIPSGRMLRVLAGSDSERGRKFFGVDLNGIELRADDLDWSLGSGTPLSGRAQDLLLVLCGRKVPEGRLRGEPGARFTR